MRGSDPETRPERSQHDGSETDDGSELAFAPDLESDASDEDLRARLRVPEPAEPRTVDELREKYASEMGLLREHRIHTHADRAVHSLPQEALERPLGTAEAIPRVGGADAEVCSAAAFAASRYARGAGRPVILTGLAEEWRASAAWASAAAITEQRGAIAVRVTELPPLLKGFGRPREVRLPLALFAELCETTTADDPFYAFDHDFTGAREELLADFKVPPQFVEDIYDLDATTRSFYPQYRHIIIGGRRTGTNLHIDPKFTCAWNTSLSGRKRWICFPPGTDPNEIGAGETYQARTPVPYWWLDVYPTLDLARLGAVEGVQAAGETIFVPEGWWHAVLNLDFCAAITQNLVLPGPMTDNVLPKIRKEFPEFGEYLACACGAKAFGEDAIPGTLAEPAAEMVAAS